MILNLLLVGTFIVGFVLGVLASLMVKELTQFPYFLYFGGAFGLLGLIIIISGCAEDVRLTTFKCDVDTGTTYIIDDIHTVGHNGKVALSSGTHTVVYTSSEGEVQSQRIYLPFRNLPNTQSIIYLCVE